MINPCNKSNPCSSQPSVVVVQSLEGIKGLSNAFVYVESINTTFFVSPCHEITVISSAPVFVDNYSADVNPLNLRGQTVYDFANNVGYVYNEAGEYRAIELKEIQ